VRRPHHHLDVVETNIFSGRGARTPAAAPLPRISLYGQGKKKKEKEGEGGGGEACCAIAETAHSATAPSAHITILTLEIIVYSHLGRVTLYPGGKKKEGDEKKREEREGHRTIKV